MKKRKKLMIIFTSFSFLLICATTSLTQPPTKPVKQPKITYGEKWADIYGGDNDEWGKAQDALRKDSEIILTIYHIIACPQKPGQGRAIIGFMVSKNNKLMPFPPPLVGSPSRGYAQIPADWKCGVTRATGYIDIYVSGELIKSGKKKFIRLTVDPGYDKCIFQSDLPQYDPLHGKTCGAGPSSLPGSPWEIEIPFENGYITNFPGVFKFALEVVRK